MSASAVSVRFDDSERLTVALDDGRELRVPLSKFPRLAGATPAQRAKVRISPSGRGLHWGEIDEDLSVDGLIRSELG